MEMTNTYTVLTCVTLCLISFYSVQSTIAEDHVETCADTISSASVSSCDSVVTLLSAYNGTNEASNLAEAWQDCDQSKISYCHANKKQICICLTILTNSGIDLNNTDIELNNTCHLDVLYDTQCTTDSPTLSPTQSPTAQPAANTGCVDKEVTIRMKQVMKDTNNECYWQFRGEKPRFKDCSTLSHDCLLNFVEEITTDEIIGNCYNNNTLFEQTFSCYLHSSNDGTGDNTGAASNPTASPTSTQAANQISSPTASPTANPTAYPTPNPIPNAIFNRTHDPTPCPTPNPTREPTWTPTSSPTLSGNNTRSPSHIPTNDPTLGPTTKFPTSYPTNGSLVAYLSTNNGTSSTPTFNTTLKPTDNATYWDSFSETGGNASNDGQNQDTGSSQSLIIMGIIILGLCLLGIYCNRSRKAFEISDESQKKGKKGGFEKLDDSDSNGRGSKLKGSADYNDFYEDSSGEGTRNIDDTMVSQRVKLGNKNKNKPQRKINNGLMTKHRTRKTDQVKFEKVGENEGEDESDTSDLMDDGMDTGRKSRKRRKNKNSKSSSTKVSKKGNINIDVDDDDDFDSEDSGGGGGMRVIPNPYAKNKKSTGFAFTNVIGEKFETFKESVSKLNSKKENVVVIPMQPVGNSYNDGTNEKSKKTKSKKKQLRDYGQVGSGIRRKKPKVKVKTSKKQQKADMNSSETDSNDSNNNNGKKRKDSKKDDVFKICENDNVSDDFNITDSDGSSSDNSSDAVKVRVTKFGRGIKQPSGKSSKSSKSSKGSKSKSKSKTSKKRKNDGSNGVKSDGGKKKKDSEMIGNGGGSNGVKSSERKDELAPPPLPDKEFSSSRGGLLDNGSNSDDNES